MELIKKTVSLTERIYCPSTDEVLIAPDLKNINSKAEAFIGCWQSIALDRPSIKNQDLKDAWSRYVEKNLKKTHPTWEDYQAFFREYENPNWVAYECEFRGDPSMPFFLTDIYVVKADTVLEEDPKQNAN